MLVPQSYSRALSTRFRGVITRCSPPRELATTSPIAQSLRPVARLPIRSARPATTNTTAQEQEPAQVWRRTSWKRHALVSIAGSNVPCNRGRVSAPVPSVHPVLSLQHCLYLNSIQHCLSCHKSPKNTYRCRIVGGEPYDWHQESW